MQVVTLVRSTGTATLHFNCETLVPPIGRLSDALCSHQQVSAGEERKIRIPYMSVALEAKSERERYILVAAIVSVSTEGSWNICVMDRY